MQTLPTRRVLVTGANRGLGLEFVRQLLARGDIVLAACREPERAEALAALMSTHPEKLQVLALDVTDPAHFPAFALETAKRTPALDCLINNAGMLPTGERFGELHQPALAAAFATNCAGPLLLTQALAPLLAKGTEPRVLNISSVLGSIASTTACYSPSYAISKAALNMAGRLMGHALAEQHIRTVNMHPGWVHTDMGGGQAPLEPAESVRAMLDTLDRLPADAHGVFVDRLGEPMPW
jgi:NAD(P)-dependent dehydrogenase (short-subunit alcohol dehydrogenase family)